jgi:hypothetical protein
MIENRQNLRIWSFCCMALPFQFCAPSLLPVHKLTRRYFQKSAFAEEEARFAPPRKGMNCTHSRHEGDFFPLFVLLCGEMDTHGPA